MFFARFISITRGHANAGDKSDVERFNSFKSLAKHYDIKSPRVFDIVLLAVIAFIFIVTFILLQSGVLMFLC